MIMESYYDGGEEREFRAQCERRKRMQVCLAVGHVCGGGGEVAAAVVGINVF